MISGESLDEFGPIIDFVAMEFQHENADFLQQDRFREQRRRSEWSANNRLVMRNILSSIP
ncbi:hypothetical protein UNPA324_08965 [Bradyrhizobium sp. UNPA324]|nr:hypothetical protein UNPA324_08965 [Bradyrhizobium sp. UNPA324]